MPTNMETRWIFEGSFSFYSPINRETSFGSTSLSKNALSEMIVKINDEGYGYFEWEIEELGEYVEGGLWFDGKAITDYDGVFELPIQLVEYLEKNGFNMDYVKD